MNRIPPKHIEIDLDSDDDATVTDAWFNAKTERIDFDEPVLSCDAKLVFGYLTMEHHGAFEELTLEEQQRVVERLKY